MAFQVNNPQINSILNAGIRKDIDLVSDYFNLCHTANIGCPAPTYAHTIKLEDEYELGDCFLMNIVNLASPTWIKVSCNQPLVQHVFCQISRNKTINPFSIKINPDPQSCLKLYILQNNTCYLFTWHKLGTRIQETCPSKRLGTFNIHQFQILFDAVTDIFPPMFSPNLEYIITYKRYWNTYSYNLDSDYSEKEGMYVCEIHKSEHFVADHVFKCSSGSYISHIFVCDGTKHCFGDVATDEVDCECNITLNYSSKCKHINTASHLECSDLYFKTWNNTCRLYDLTLLSGKSLIIFIENMQSQGPSGQQHLTDRSQSKAKLSCQTTDFSNHTFYEISEICSYKLNGQGYLRPCSKGEHLQNCKMFKCNIMFKCPDFYCIPWGYICDGKWDCPKGYDESIYQQCENRAYINMFKCKMSSVCIHLGDVCNGQFDCPYHDDELLCLLKDTTCPLDCQCLAFALRCYSTYISEYTLPIYFPYISVTIINCTLSIKDTLKRAFQYVFFQSLTNTKFENICNFVSFMKQVITLDVSKNKINKMKTYCFKSKITLKVIKLNDNMLQHVEKFAFYNLVSLSFIDLSNNKLTAVFKNSIIGSDKLSFLSLENNTLDATRSKNIQYLDMKFLQIDYFPLCCFTKNNVKCSAKKPWYMSCSQLLVNNLVKKIFYFLSFIVVVVNALHLLVQRKFVGEKQKCQKAAAFESIVISISLLDMIGSFPIFILWISDLYFKDNLILMQNQWKSSIFCFISGGVNIFYGLASPFLYNLLSYIRYAVVKNPINSNFKRSDYIFKIIFVGCIFTLFSATLVLTLFWWTSGRMPTIYCSPFFHQSSVFSLAKKLAWLIIGVNFIAVSFNLIIHSKLVVQVMLYKNDNLRTKSRYQSKMSLFVQIICITCSHLLCWLLGMLVLLTANIQTNYPTEIIIIQIVVITPLNSILVPIIFITKTFKALTGQ